MIETRGGLELRAEAGRRIVGRAMAYGATAEVRMLNGAQVTESFAHFAFHDYLRSGAATRLNLQHDGTIEVASTGTTSRGKLELRDHPDGLDLIATLPDGDVYTQVLDLVRAGDLAQTSIEFRALRENITGKRRIISSATLPAISIVERGSYGEHGAVEVRAKGRGIAGTFRYNRDRVTADRGRVRKERVRPGAFAYALEDESREIILQIGDDAGQVLGSRRAGSLILNDTKEALEFEVETLPATSYADDLVALLDSDTIAPGVVPFFRIPPPEVVPDAAYLEPDAENPNDVEVRVIASAVLTALSLRYRAPRGNPGEVERRHHRDRERVRTERASRGRRVWL